MRKTKERLKKQNAIIASGMFLGGVIIILLMWFLFRFNSDKVEVDRNTFCRKNETINTTLILIDRTGSFSQSQVRSIRDIVESEVNNVNTGDKIVIRTIDAELYNGASHIYFERCKPKGVNELNKIIENEYKLKRQYEKNFVQPLNEVIEKIINGKDASTSPIVESLFDVISRDKLENFEDVTKVILISDLLQHSRLMSVYKNNLRSIDDNKELARIIPDFSGIDVHIYWILRSNTEGQLQSEGLLLWWEKLLEVSSVSNISFDKVR